MSVELPKYVTKDYIKSKDITNQTFYTKGILSSAFKRAWNAGYTGKGIIVAVIDTGIDNVHPDLKGKVINSINFTNEPLSQSHGTHVAGTIAANGWLKGGAYDCQLIDIKALATNGGTIANIVKAIRYAVDYGATVINMSLGTTRLPQSDIDQMNAAINYAWSKGVLCVAASGNDGTSVGTPDPYSYPAAIDKVYSVAACIVGEDLNQIQLSYFSNENNKVDIAACGQDVLSSVIGGKYAIFSGTSMATPHVTAMAAILAQYSKAKYPKVTGALFCEQLTSALTSNALTMNTIKTFSAKGKSFLKVKTVNSSYGNGFIRYQPNQGPDAQDGTKVYNQSTFLGYNKAN
jgi:major intracellular serine protease